MTELALFMGRFAPALVGGAGWGVVALVIWALVKSLPVILQYRSGADGALQKSMSERLAGLDVRVRHLEAQVAILAGGLIDMIGELPADSEARARGRAVLRDAFPVNYATPASMSDLLAEIDRRAK